EARLDQESELRKALGVGQRTILKAGKYYRGVLSWGTRCNSLSQLGQRGFAMIYAMRRDLIGKLNTNAAHGGLGNQTRQGFSKRLNELKAVVGHGSWETWRASTFPKLSKRSSCNCMALDRNNPNVQKSAHLSAESVRKFRFGYVPVKDRPKLKGDKKFARPS